MNIPSAHPARRSRLALIGLVFLTLLIVFSLAQAGIGAAALSLFQSPSSPVVGEAQSAAEPIVPAAAQPATPSGLSVPTWLIVVVATVLVVALVVVISLARRARR